jgi:hypothetical protein
MVNIDGSTLYPADLGNPFQQFVLAFLIIHSLILVTVTFLVGLKKIFLPRGGTFILAGLITTIICSTLQFVHWYTDCSALVSWLLVVSTTLVVYSTLLGQFEVLQVFTLFSDWIKERTVLMWKRYLIIWYCISCLGCFLYIPWVGTTPPPVVNIYFLIGFPLFVFTGVIYDAWQNAFVAYHLYHHIKKAELKKKLETTTRDKQSAVQKDSILVKSDGTNVSESQSVRQFSYLHRHVLLVGLAMIWGILTILVSMYGWMEDSTNGTGSEFKRPVGALIVANNMLYWQPIFVTWILANMRSVQLQITGSSQKMAPKKENSLKKLPQKQEQSAMLETVKMHVISY